MSSEEQESLNMFDELSVPPTVTDSFLFAKWNIRLVTGGVEGKQKEERRKKKKEYFSRFKNQTKV